MPRSHKPDRICEVSDDYRTDDLEIAGKEMLDKWDDKMTFDILADEGEYSPGHYSNVYHENMGPPDDPKNRTFGEVREMYGTIKNYYEKRRVVEPELQTDDGLSIDTELATQDDLSERDIFMLKQGYRIAKEEEDQLE